MLAELIEDRAPGSVTLRSDGRERPRNPRGSQGAGPTEVLALVEDVLARHPPATTPARDFLLARYEAGLAWVWFPPGYGGLGLPPELQTVADRAVAEAGGANTTVGSVGYMMTASALVTYGADQLKRRFLPTIPTNDEVWCQLFSEPGAGSDLAASRHRRSATATSGSSTVRRCGQRRTTPTAACCSARTDPDVPKHNGLTYFIVDMHAPGVEVRPIRQIDR